MEDPYFDTNICVERLYNHYIADKKLIIAVDFDSTLFDYHRENHTFPKVIEILKECQKLDFYLCIFSSSPPDRHYFMQTYCSSIGIKIHAINTNPIPLPFGNNGAKPFFNILLDDRAGLGQSYEILRKTLDRIAAKE